MKKILKFAGVFFVTLAILFGLLVLSCTIPQEKIYENSKESAKFMTEKEKDFYMPLLSGETFELHDYADAIWLSIAYGVDSEHPLRSALEGKYYNGFGDRLYNINFYRDAVNDKIEPNTYYYRYWHGPILFLRPLLTQFTYIDIRYMNVLLLTGLCFVLMILLQNKLDIKASVIFALAILSVNFFVVPYCLEYVPMFYVMFISSIMILYLQDKQKIFYLFLITGICSNFFDFLTVETITLCVPLVIHFYDLYLKGAVNSVRKNLIYFIKLCACWLCGYMFTWMSKWVISAVVLRTHVMTNVGESISQRSVGKIEKVSFGEQLKGALLLNVRNLLPFRITKGPAGTIIMVLAILCLLLAVWFVYRKKKIEEVTLIFLLIAWIPYVRYLVMSNHSYAHDWFTFRAQLSTVMAVLLALIVNLDKDLIHKEFRRRRQKGS